VRPWLNDRPRAPRLVRPEHSPTECPGLVLEWRRDSEGEWQARVTYVEPRGLMVTDWLPAEKLRPVGVSPRS